MNLKEVIYDSLWNEHGAQGQFLWEEVVEPSSKEREFGSTVPTEENKRFALLRVAELEQRDLVSDYLAAAFPGKFIRGHGLTLSDRAFTTFAGSIDDRLIDVVSVSTIDYRTTVLDSMLAVPAAAKAFILGFQKVDIAALDRSNQSWFWYTITGNFAAAYLYLRDVVQGKRPSRFGRLTAEPNHLLTQEMDALIASIGTDKEVKGGLKVREKRVIHPSEISTTPCDRKIAYSLNGEDEQERESLRFKKLRKIFDLGHIFHNIIQQALVWAIPDFKPEAPAYNKDLRIFGKCDGAFGKKGIEIKSISLAGFQKLTKPKAEHVEQATIYAVNLGLDAIYYIYVCKETAELAIFEIPVNRHLWHQIATRATKILQLVDRGEMPERIEGKISVCKACRFSWTCRTDLVPPSTERMFSR